MGSETNSEKASRMKNIQALYRQVVYSRDEAAELKLELVSYFLEMAMLELKLAVDSPGTIISGGTSDEGQNVIAQRSQVGLRKASLFETA